MTYRVGRHFPIHVYQGDRPVATFHDADEAQRFVDAVNRPRKRWRIRLRTMSWTVPAAREQA